MKKSKGFTLLELMIVVVIIAIIATVALMNYARYGYRSRRVDGKEMLARVAAAQERYYTNYNKYAPDLTTLGFTALNRCAAAGCSDRAYYLVSTAYGADNQSYLLTATGRPPQDQDACGNLTLDNANTKSFTGNQSNGNCW